MIQFLLHHGADMSCTDNAGRTALHEAARCGQTEAVRILLQQQECGVSTLSDAGETALDVAKGDAIRCVCRGASSRVVFTDNRCLRVHMHAVLSDSSQKSPRSTDFGV